MKKLSTGEDSTLGNYRKLTSIFFGENSKAVKFLDEKIAASPNGEAEEVIADERQMIYISHSMDQSETANDTSVTPHQETLRDALLDKPVIVIPKGTGKGLLTDKGNVKGNLESGITKEL